MSLLTENIRSVLDEAYRPEPAGEPKPSVSTTPRSVFGENLQSVLGEVKDQPLPVPAPPAPSFLGQALGLGKQAFQYIGEDLGTSLPEFGRRTRKEFLAGIQDIPEGGQKVIAPESTIPDRLLGLVQTTFGLPRAILSPLTASVEQAYDVTFDALPEGVKTASVTLPLFGETTVRQISESFGKPLAVNLAFIALGKMQIKSADMAKTFALRDQLRREEAIRGKAIETTPEVRPTIPPPAEFDIPPQPTGDLLPPLLKEPSPAPTPTPQARTVPVVPVEPSQPTQSTVILQAAKELRMSPEAVMREVKPLIVEGISVEDALATVKSQRLKPPAPPGSTIPESRPVIIPSAGVVQPAGRLEPATPIVEAAPEASAVRPPAVKQPWEITYKEATGFTRSYPKYTPELLKARSRGDSLQSQLSELWDRHGRSGSDYWGLKAQELEPQLQQAKIEFQEWHKRQVAEALQRGKSVPTEVLAEYPDLVKRATSPTAATQPKLFQTQAELPPTPLQPKAPQVEPAPPELPLGIERADMPVPLEVTWASRIDKRAPSALKSRAAEIDTLDVAEFASGGKFDYLTKLKLTPSDEKNRVAANMVIHFENRSLNPNAVNPTTNDFGLFQFSPTVAGEVGGIRKGGNPADHLRRFETKWLPELERRIGSDDPKALTLGHLNQKYTKQAVEKGGQAPLTPVEDLTVLQRTPTAVSEQPIEAAVEEGLAARPNRPPEAVIKEVELHAGIPVPKGIREAFGRGFIPNYKYDSEFIAAIRERRSELVFSGEKAVEASRSLSKGLTKEQRFEAGAALKGQTRLTDPLMQAKVEKVRANIDTLSQEIKAEGLLSEKTIDPNLGKYTRRLYLRDILGDQWADTVKTQHPEIVQEAKDYLISTQKIAGKAISEAQADDLIQRILQPKRYGGASIQGAKSLRIDQSPLKPRQDIPLELRRLMGEVEDGGYLAGRTMLDQSSMLINKRFFDRIGKGSEIIDGQEVPWFRDTPAEGYSKFALPDTPSLGAARNKYILEKYEGEFTELTKVKGEIEQLYERAYSTWKAFRTVDNPATHGRNIIGDIGFADFAGVSPFNPLNWKYYVQSIRELAKGGAMRDEALRSGAIGTEYATAELRQLMHELGGAETGVVNGLFGFIEKVNRPLSKLYNAEDQVFKLASFIKQRTGGASIKEAAAHVNNWFPNYAEVGKAVKALRTSPIGAPFVSFQAEAARIYANALKEHPIKLFKWAVAIPGGITAYAAAKNGMSFDDLKDLHTSLPDALRRKYLVLLPMKDKDDNLRVWDISYILPLADTFGAKGLPYIGNVVLSHPFVNTLLQVSADYNFATKRPITEPGTNRSESAVNFILQQALPSLTPGVGYGAKRIESAIKGEPRQYPYLRTETPGEALTGALTPFGTIPLDEEVQIKKRTEDMGKRRQLEEQFYKVRRNRSLTDEEREQRLDRLREQRQEFQR